jgi:hypothetical protein
MDFHPLVLDGFPSTGFGWISIPLLFDGFPSTGFRWISIHWFWMDFLPLV